MLWPDASRPGNGGPHAPRVPGTARGTGLRRVRPAVRRRGKEAQGAKAPDAEPALRLRRSPGRVLVATAHPDDETLAMGGTLAWLAHRGLRVTIVCATRGELGWIADPLLATRDSLAAVREQELRRAAQVLGVDDVCLLDYRDGTLPGIDPAELAGAFAAAIRRLRPQIVFTWGPEGGYGHPDHIAVCRAVTAAFNETAGGPDAAQALYYFAVWPPALVRGLRRLTHRPRRPATSCPPQRAPRWSTAIDVSAYRRQRMEALRQHRTQLPADPWLRRIDALLAPRNNFAFSRVERFYRAAPPVLPAEPIEFGLQLGGAAGARRQGSAAPAHTATVATLAPAPARASPAAGDAEPVSPDGSMATPWGTRFDTRRLSST